MSRAMLHGHESSAPPRRAVPRLRFGSGDALPRLDDVALDAHGLSAALTAISERADYLDVFVRVSTPAGAASRRVSLDDARALLSSGKAVALQLSYRVNDTNWSDTVTRTEDGFRLLRVPRSLGGYSLGGE